MVFDMELREFGEQNFSCERIEVCNVILRAVVSPNWYLQLSIRNKCIASCVVEACMEGHVLICARAWLSPSRSVTTKELSQASTDTTDIASKQTFYRNLRVARQYRREVERFTVGPPPFCAPIKTRRALTGGHTTNVNRV